MGVENKSIVEAGAPERLLFGMRLPDLPNDGIWDGDESSGFSRTDLSTKPVELSDEEERLTVEEFGERVQRRGLVYPGKQIDDNS